MHMRTRGITCFRFGLSQSIKCEGGECICSKTRTTIRIVATARRPVPRRAEQLHDRDDREGRQQRVPFLAALHPWRHGSAARNSRRGRVDAKYASFTSCMVPECFALYLWHMRGFAGMILVCGFLTLCSSVTICCLLHVCASVSSALCPHLSNRRSSSTAAPSEAARDRRGADFGTVADGESARQLTVIGDPRAGTRVVRGEVQVRA